MIHRDTQPPCTWPECPMPPVVRVKYVRAKDPDPRLAWLPSNGGLAAVCERHALELCETLGTRQWLGLRCLD